MFIGFSQVVKKSSSLKAVQTLSRKLSYHSECFSLVTKDPNMSHASQNTKAEYANRHVPQNTSKMASLWEKKIGEDKAQKRSPVAISKYASALSGKAASPAKTAREEPPEIVLKMGPLADADEVQSENTSEQDPLELRKQKTLDIAQTFEEMASAKKQPSGRVHAKVGRGASVAGGNQPSGGAKDGRGTSLATKKNIPSAVKANTGAKEAISSYKKAELKGLIAEMSDHITQLNSDLTTLKTKFNEL